MKILVLFTLSFCFSNLSAQTAQQFYNLGEAALRAKNLEKAKSAFESALEKDPNHFNARYALEQIEASSGALATEKKYEVFNKVVIDEFKLEGASLEEALELLQKKVELATKGAEVKNFIVKDPTGKFAAKKITLNLKAVPASAVLKYISEAAAANIAYGQHGIIVTP